VLFGFGERGGYEEGDNEDYELHVDVVDVGLFED
jgi:hypothetical protein